MRKHTVNKHKPLYAQVPDHPLGALEAIEQVQWMLTSLVWSTPAQLTNLKEAVERMIDEDRAIDKTISFGEGNERYKYPATFMPHLDRLLGLLLGEVETEPEPVKEEVLA